MNWTGGSLRRTKNANKGVIQKQKAYFARTRTHLQNGSPPNATSFKPNYALENDTTNSVRHLHIEGLTRPFRDSKSIVHLPQDSAGAPRYRPRDSVTRDLPKLRAVLTDDEATFREFQGRGLTSYQNAKRKRNDTHTESTLLDARRTQLLKKHDWIGVAPSQPILPSFLACKDMTRIGKRRKARGSHGAIVQHWDRMDVAARSPQHLGDGYSGAVKTRNAGHLNDIRIRIGTDALTTIGSTIPNDPIQSFTSSESMLFDQQSHEAECLDAIRSTKPLMSPADVVEMSVGQLPSEQLPHFNTARANAPSDCISTRRSRMQVTQARGVGMPVAKEVVAHEQPDSYLPIKQYVEGVGQPFRLVFDSPNSFESNPSQDNLNRDVEVGDTDCARVAAYAGDSKKKHTHELSGKAGIQFESEAAVAACDIVDDADEAVWKSILNLAEQSSSQTRAPKISGTSAVHVQPKAQSHEVEHYSWSQHATQGDQTRIDSSLISASLPSLRHAGWLHTKAHRAENMKRQDLMTNTILDQEELLWQNFVFGSNEGSSSGDEELHRRSGSIQDWEPSSGVPLSVAVSPVSTTPFRAGHAPRIVDSVENTAMLAPPSGSRTFPSSAATAGNVDKVRDGESERSASARQSVTHSSLVNNASGATNLSCSGMSGRTETFRGGREQTDRSRESLLGHDAGSPWRSLYSDPDPDGWEFDPVDPDRIL